MRPMPLAILLLALAVPALVACGGPARVDASPGSTLTQPPPESLEVATFAGGCFWCMEPPFEKLDGVVSVVSGYTGGPEVDPTYEQVSYGRTGHAEAVEITYDPSKIGYAELLEVFWRNIDPTAVDRQFADRGKQYRTGIYVHSDEQRRLAEESKTELAENGPFDQPLVTPILDAGPFYRAEEYHQDFYKKNPARYKAYYVGSGRAGFLEKTWGEAKGE